MKNRLTVILSFISIFLITQSGNCQENNLYPANNNKQGKSGYLNEKMQTVIPFKFDKVMPFSEGYAVVVVDDKYGFINTKGEIVIEPQFDYAKGFIDGVVYGSYWKEGGNHLFW
jgi:hypothetical protein